MQIYGVKPYIAVILIEKLFLKKSADIQLRYSIFFSLKKCSSKMSLEKVVGNFKKIKNLSFVLKNQEIQKKSTPMNEIQCLAEKPQ